MDFAPAYLVQQFFYRLIDFFHRVYEDLLCVITHRRSAPPSPRSFSHEELYFNDPRLRMTVGGRFTVRVVSYIANFVLIFAMATFFLSEIKTLRYLGLFLIIFFIVRIAHRGEADMQISELPREGKINVAKVMRPAALVLLGRVFDHGRVTRNDFFLSVVDRLTGIEDIEKELRDLHVAPQEFRAKLAEFLTKEIPAVTVSREAYLKNAEALAVAAFHEALAAGHDVIELGDLFSAVRTMKDEFTNRLFAMFSISK